MNIYEIPEIEIILFDTLDVITTSDPTQGEIDRPDEGGDLGDFGDGDLGGW